MLPTEARSDPIYMINTAKGINFPGGIFVMQCVSDLIDNIIIRFDSAALNARRDQTLHIQSQDYIRTGLPSTKLFLVSPVCLG